MKILATIAARKGSKGVKNKSIRPLLGKPLIAHSIEQMQAWDGYDQFIITTDSDEVARIAEEYKVAVPFRRPEALATDEANKMDALRHALITCEQVYKQPFAALLDLDLTAPVRSVDDIRAAVARFEKTKPDCLFSVVKARRNPYFNMVEVNQKGEITLCKKPPQDVHSRQKAPVVYAMNASIYVYNRNFLLNPKNTHPLSGRAEIYEMSEDSAFDIDSETDFRLVEFILKTKGDHKA